MFQFRRKTVLALGVSVWSLSALAQGVVFDTQLSWAQVQAKAKAENKYVFIDVMATWCGPCKKMDKAVYPLAEVGNAVNPKFIAIKVQQDKTAGDNEYTKSWYNDAAALIKTHGVGGYPSYLVFSPTGEMIFKDAGYKSPALLVQMLKDATDPTMNPQKRYAMAVESYKAGSKDPSLLEYIYTHAMEMKDVATGAKAGRDYVDYLMTLPEEEIYTRENLVVISNYGSLEQTKAFNLFYKDAVKVDAVLGKGASKQVVKEMVAKQLIQPAISDAMKAPEWGSLQKKIAKKYGTDMAEELIIVGKMDWLRSNIKATGKFNQELTRLRFVQWEKYGFDSTSYMGLAGFNNIAFTEVVAKVSNKELIKKTLNYYQVILRKYPFDENKPGYGPANFLDTYACLLYKDGQVDKAIGIEEKIVKYFPTDKGFAGNLDKMKKGEPMW